MKKTETIVEYYEKNLKEHGDNHLGVAWPKYEDAQTRYRVMLDVLNFGPRKAGKKLVQLLDFGCGTGHFKEYLDKVQIQNIEYSGLDISAKFVEVSQKKFPGTPFYCLDVNQGASGLPVFDYAILNGVFTVKCDLSFEDMWSHTKQTLLALFPHVSEGLAVNFMSKHVDWERPDLFHLPFDGLADFFKKQLSRNFMFRQDYGLYEYTAYIYK
jgi:SAM-dependent methyltransferase